MREAPSVALAIDETPRIPRFRVGIFRWLASTTRGTRCSMTVYTPSSMTGRFRAFGLDRMKLWGPKYENSRWSVVNEPIKWRILRICT
ncbi:hypothetical protein BGY98DRAFT_411090 [Russula aff. rugulosa BPL654]|nr:hypothetical protein BGY98DRAFT_411090 [Russula aff. rugulosa BPL654]